MGKNIIFKIVGILFILGALGFMLFSFISTMNYVKTEATVVSVEYDPSVIYDPDDPTSSDDHIVTLEYVVDGKTYKSELHARQNDYTVGQKTEISYDPGNPNSIAAGQMSLPVIIVISAVVLVIGIAVVIKGARSIS